MKRLGRIVNARVPGLPGMKATLIKQSKNVAMYLREDNIYEVGIIKTAKAEELFGKQYPEREVYWSSEDFGKIALATNHKDKAESFYKGFLQNVSIVDIPYTDKWSV